MKLLETFSMSHIFRHPCFQQQKKLSWLKKKKIYFTEQYFMRKHFSQKCKTHYIKESRPHDSCNCCRHFLYSGSQFFQVLLSKVLHYEIAIITNFVLFLLQLQKMKEKKGLYPDKSVYTQQVGPGCCFGALALMLHFYFEVINIKAWCLSVNKVAVQK